MLNRYSNLPKSTIINTQVLTDLGVIDTALQRQQKVYDNQAAGVAKTAQAANDLSFVGDAANGFKDKLNEDLKSKVNDWSKLDLADPTVKAEVNGYISSLASNPELQKHTQVKALYDEHQKQIQDLSSKGKLHDNQLALQNLAWEKYKKDGTISDELQQPLYEAQDLVKGRSDLVSMIKASGTDIIAALEDGTAYKNSSKGISSDRIKKAVEAQLPTYANSAYGRQEATDYKVAKLNGSIPQNTSFADYLVSQVMSTASNFAYSQNSTNKDIALRSKQTRDLQTKKEEETILTGTEGFNNPNIPANKQFNSDGQIREQNTVSSWLFGNAFGDQQLTEESKNLPENKQLMVAAKVRGLTPKEYVDKYSQKQSIPVFNYVKETSRTNLTSLISKNGAGLINSAPIIDKSGKIVGTLKDILISQGVEDNPEAIKEATKALQVTGKIGASPVSADGLRISLNGEDLILDLTQSLLDKASANLASKEELNKLAQFNEQRHKAGFSEVIETQEGEAASYWDDDSSSIKYKLIN